jgi:non-ribosomal peptide synthetase component F
MNFNLADLFESVADAVPERTALVCGEQRRTFAQLDRRANQCAHALIARGVHAGDVVGLYLMNDAEYIEAMIGCFKLRAFAERSPDYPWAKKVATEAAARN